MYNIYIKKLKSSRTYLIGYSNYILCESLLIAWGRHTDTDLDINIHTDLLYFKKPGTTGFLFTPISDCCVTLANCKLTALIGMFECSIRVY